ncbi:MAG: SAM-dependent methyltransferase [Bacteroidales bacterium]|nr:SAM-dependent methyltransferase [Bacteroidales bacterium]
MVFGTLYLVPNLLGATKPEQVLPSGTLDIVRRLKYFVVENTRTTRRVLSRIGMDHAIDEMEFIELDKHNARNLDLMEHLGPCLRGEDMGLMSEAGTPCVADPGALVVDLAHSAGIKVVPLVGPNAMILALMASGFNGQSFAFQGYLPIKSPDRQNAIRNLERRSQSNNETELFIETPFRNNAMIQDLCKNLHPGTRLCVACNLTCEDELVISQDIAEWKKFKGDLNKKPAVFLVYRRLK